MHDKCVRKTKKGCRSSDSLTISKMLIYTNP